MRKLIYARVSTDMQNTQTQLDMCKELAKKHGEGETLTFVDEATSSSIPMVLRPQLQAFLNEICKDDLVIVYDLDRIGRDLIEGATIYRDIKALGAKITSVVDQNCDNELMVNIKFSIAQEEKRKIKLRTIDALMSKQNRFEKVGQVWYGYTLDKNIIQTQERARTFGKPFKLIPEPTEQKAITLMKDLYQQGYSYQKIADELNSQGFVSRAGTQWLKGSVHRILQRELTHPALGAKQVQFSLV